MKSKLVELIHQRSRSGSRLPAGLERLADLGRSPQRGIATGFDELSKRLPGHGWPVGALTEIVTHAEGAGELRLTIPALAELTAQRKRVVWVAPPYRPYAPALSEKGLQLSRVMLVEGQNNDENLWAAEQVLRVRETGAVLIWPTRRLDERRLRRLQLAAETGQSVAFIFSTGPCVTSSSPAALRLELNPSTKGLQVRVLKCRGGRSGDVITIRALQAKSPCQQEAVSS